MFGLGFWGVWFGILGLCGFRLGWQEFGVSGLGFGVWGLGFRVWGFGALGVLGLGLSV